MHRKQILFVAFALALTLLAVPRTLSAQTVYNVLVGAFGDDASKGNSGVGAEIRTSIDPPTGSGLATSFWVGDNLQGGAFIQFGYDLTPPGHYCLYGKVSSSQESCLGSADNIQFEDTRWFWQYWPNSAVSDFYFAIGPTNSAGADGSWHLYQIRPNVEKGWDFTLDGQTVWSFNMFQVTKSRDQAYMTAEEVSSTQSADGRLGPVEFRNLSYLDGYTRWRPVTSLRAISGCGGMSPNCDASIPYGVTVLGPNDIIAGTGQGSTQPGSLLWPLTFTLTVSAPPEIWVTIDGRTHRGGFTDLTLLQGTHSISVPEIAEVCHTACLRFEEWSDGSTKLSRTIDLKFNTMLQAIYIGQYESSLGSPP